MRWKPASTGRGRGLIALGVAAFAAVQVPNALLLHGVSTRADRVAAAAGRVSATADRQAAVIDQLQATAATQSNVITSQAASLDRLVALAEFFRQQSEARGGPTPPPVLAPSTLNMDSGSVATSPTPAGAPPASVPRPAPVGTTTTTRPGPYASCRSILNVVEVCP